MAIQFGNPFLFENVDEELDPLLDPVLEKSVVKEGNGLVIKLGMTMCYSSVVVLSVFCVANSPVLCCVVQCMYVQCIYINVYDYDFLVSYIYYLQQIFVTLHYYR